MGAKFSFKYILTGVLLLLMAKELQAQFRQLPVDYSSGKNFVPMENLRIKAGPLTLPFWEDFSTGTIDTLKWQNNGTSASKTIGIDPPSLGVAYLDGVDRGGEPYSTSMMENGEGDQLTSQEIDLSTHQAADSVYLSFFWQAGGKGEMPDVPDKLELYFLDTSGTWIQAWEIFGGDVEKRDVFSQEMVKVTDDFIHNDFRFKFINTGRISGPFDSWLLDYIYLNQGRNVNDVYHEDRALTKLPNSPFGKYSALPLFELNRNKGGYLTAISSQFKNLSNRFRAMEYSVELRDKETQVLLKSIHAQTPFNPVPQALERRDFNSVDLKDIDVDPAEEFDLETLLFLTTGDQFQIDQITEGDTLYFPQVDFRINDTIRHTIPIRDFFAYDNGSVDYAAGINQRSGMLALKYELDTSAYLKGVSINFANLSQVGSAVEVMVWNSLESAPIYTEEIIIPDKSRLEEFAYFPMDTNLVVSDTFFIGFRQFTNDFIYIGLDKSNNSGSEIFYNVTGSWEQNEEVQGSLMMRPHLSINPVVAQNGTEGEVGIKIYPNPVTEKLYLEGKIGEVIVFDSFGRQINIPVDTFEKGKILNFVGNDKGVYVVRAWTGKKPNSIRILVK